MKEKNKHHLFRYLLCVVLYLITLWIAMSPTGEDENASQLDHMANTEMEGPANTMGSN